MILIWFYYKIDVYTNALSKTTSVKKRIRDGRGILRIAVGHGRIMHFQQRRIPYSHSLHREMTRRIGSLETFLHPYTFLARLTISILSVRIDFLR